MTPDSAAVPLGEAMPLAAVERQLASARQDPARAHQTATHNLICRVRDAAEAEALLPRLAVIARHHPGRILVLAPAPEAAGNDHDWRARIAQAPAAAGNDHELEPAAAPGHDNEIVVLDSGGAALVSAAAAASPLLRPDLPVFLWWRGGNPIGDRGFEELAALADRCFIDSQALNLPPEQLAAYARLQAECARRFRLTDLAWTRLTPWRQLLAQAFDGRETRPCLDRLTEVALTSRCGQPAINGGAVLLAGWLAAALNWKPQARTGPLELHLAMPRGGTVRLAFAATESGSSRALLHRVELSAGDELRVSVHQESGRVVLDLSGAAVAARSGGEFRNPEEVDLVCQEMDLLGPDLLFYQALDRGLEVLRALEMEAR